MYYFRQVCFGRYSCQSLITINLEECVVLFDVLEHSIKHVLEVEAALICQDEYSDLVAVFTKNHECKFNCILLILTYLRKKMNLGKLRRKLTVVPGCTVPPLIYRYIAFSVKLLNLTIFTP